MTKSVAHIVALGAPVVSQFNNCLLTFVGVTNKRGWQANYKDIIDLDRTISPIILAGLKRFRKVMDDKSDFFGVPSSIAGNLPDYGEKPDEYNQQIEEGFEEWKSRIDKMIFAFDGSNEPDIMDYDFSFPNFTNPDEGGHCDTSVDNEEEYQRYKNDEKAWEKARKEGFKLFADHYLDLWW